MSESIYRKRIQLLNENIEKQYILISKYEQTRDLQANDPRVSEQCNFEMENCRKYIQEYEAERNDLESKLEKKSDSEIEPIKKPQKNRKKIGFQLSKMIEILSERMYSSELVFIRENVQNAVDSMRLYNKRANLSPQDGKIEIIIKEDLVEIRDYGVGMTSEDLITYYWAIASTSKNTIEAREAKCIGEFGIGGFANFGICSKIDVYTLHYNSDRAFYSYINREDLQQGKDDLTIEQTDDLQEHGTIVKCYPITIFDVKGIIDFLLNYIQYLPETIIVNSQIMSLKPFMDQVEIKSKFEEKAKLKKGWIKGEICEYDDNHVSYQIQKMQIESTEYEAEGEVEIGEGTLNIYKHKFFMAEYVYKNKRLSGKLDLPFLKPNASREAFDYKSGIILREIHKAITDILVKYISLDSSLVDFYKGTSFIDEISKGKNINLAENLIVTLLDSRQCTLKDLIKEGTVYIVNNRGNKEIATTIQNDGYAIVDCSDLDKKTKELVEKFLNKNCNVQKIPTFVAQEQLELTTLDEKIKIIIKKIQSNLDKQGCEHILVLPYKILPEDKFPLVLNRQEHKVMLNIAHSDFLTLVSHFESQKNEDVLEIMVDNFIKDYLGNDLMRVRNKVFGPNGRGIASILSQPDSEITKPNPKKESNKEDEWNISIMDPKPVHLTSSGTGSFWDGESDSLIRVQSDDIANISGYYIRLPDSLAEIYQKNVPLGEHDIETVSFLKYVFIIVYNKSTLKVLLELQLNRVLKGKSNYSQLKRTAIIKPKGTFIPIPNEIGDMISLEKDKGELNIKLKSLGFENIN